MHATPHALAEGYGLRIDPEHAPILQPVLDAQRRRFEEHLARVIVRLRGDEPVSLLGLLDALLLDLAALAHGRNRQAVNRG